MSNKTQQLLEIDRQRVFHASTHLKQYAAGELSGRIISSGSGIRITDSEGIELIDGFAGLYCVNIGYGRTEMADAIYEQAKELAYYHTYVGHTNEALVTLSDRIIKMAPEGMSKVYYGMSGSDANETQLKLVWYYNNARGRPEKKKFISRIKAYHGITLVSASLTGLPNNHRDFDVPFPQFKHVSCAHHWRNAHEGESEEEFATRLAKELEDKILAEGPETVAAFIGEPVMGAGGVFVPPRTYWPKIQEVCRKYDVLVVADEVINGFGRTGTTWGCTTYGIEPDIITLSKALTGGTLPLAATIAQDRIFDAFLSDETSHALMHGPTFMGNALACAAANASSR